MQFGLPIRKFLLYNNFNVQSPLSYSLNAWLIIPKMLCTLFYFLLHLGLEQIIKNFFQRDGKPIVERNRYMKTWNTSWKGFRKALYLLMKETVFLQQKGLLNLWSNQITILCLRHVKNCRCFHIASRKFTGSANQAGTRMQSKHIMKSIICMGKYLRRLV